MFALPYLLGSVQTQAVLKVAAGVSDNDQQVQGRAGSQVYQRGLGGYHSSL